MGYALGNAFMYIYGFGWERLFGGPKNLTVLPPVHSKQLIWYGQNVKGKII